MTKLSRTELRAARADIGFIHQDFRLVPNLRVLQNVLCGRLGRTSLRASLRMMMLPRAHDVRTVYALLDRVGIAAKLYQRTDTCPAANNSASRSRAPSTKPRASCSPTNRSRT